MSEDDERAEDLIGRWAERRHAGEDFSADDMARESPGDAGELRDGIETARRLGRLLHREDAASAPPERLGEFRVLRELGRGGMGVVYEAEQATMHRRVALKVLYPSITNTSKVVERFQREARAAGQLKHTNIVTVHQLGEDAGVWFCAMELVEGHSLDKVLADVRRMRPAVGRRPSSSAAESSTGAADAWRASTGERRYFQRVAEMFAEIAEALETAHGQGVVHRDVKPANLMVSSSGQLKILDFGLARIRDEPTGLTVTGGVVGTPSYMSPEQARAGAVDARSDVYSLGATLYEVLTLRPPFHAKDAVEILQKIRSEEPRLPSRVDRRIPRDVETIVLKALEKDPVRRYATAADLARDLRAFAEGRTISARRVGPVVRAWRLVKRQKVRAALAAGLVAAVSVSAALVVHSSRVREEREAEQARRIDLEYVRACAAADEAFHASSDPGPGGPRSSSETSLPGTESPQGPSPFDLFSRAIEIAPDRPEAYLGRVLCRETDPEQALADVESAASRGASVRTVHMARAYVLREMGGRDAEAEAEEAAARLAPAEDLRATLLEARIAALRGDIDRSIALLDAVLRAAPNGSALKYMARRQRGRLRAMKSDLRGALADLITLREEGDSGRPLAVQIASLWRRMKDDPAADAAIGALLEEQAARGDQVGWIELTEILHGASEWTWSEKAAAAGLAAFPDTAVLIALRGWALAATGQEDEALALGRRAVELAPRLAAGHGVVGFVHYRRGEWKDAVEPLRRASELGSVGSSHALSVALSRLDRLPEAMGAARTTIRRAPLDPDGYVALGMVFSGMHRHQDAVDAYERALVLDPVLLTATINRASSLLRLGKIEASLAGYERALELAPRSAEAMRRKARALDQAQKWDEALVAARAAVEFDGKYAEAHEQLGLSLTRVGQYDEAVAEYRTALDLDRNDPGIWCNYGRCLLDMRNWKDGLHALDKALAIDANDALTHAHRAEALYYLKKPEEALAAADAALKIDPNESDAHWHRGQALIELGKYEDAIAALRRAIDLDHRFEGEANAAYRVDLGMALRRAGHEDECMAEWSRAVEAGFENPYVYNDLAWWIAQRPDRTAESMARAEHLAAEAVRMAPEEGGIRNTLGCIRARAGDARGALEALGEAMRMQDGGDANDWYFVAIAHKALANDEEARRWFDRAVAWTAEHGPTNEDLLRFEREAAEALGIVPSPAPPK